MKKVKIADQFSRYPMGRTLEDGPDNGERFFEEYLAAQISNQLKTVIVFDGVRAFGSSFLDQVFNVIPTRLGIRRHDFVRLIEVEAKGSAYQFYKKMAEDFAHKIPA